MPTYHGGLDAPTALCSFGGRSQLCAHQVLGHGGLISHHTWPTSLGGPDHPTEGLLTLCPNHHTRQHALLRYLLTLPSPSSPSYSVIRHYTRAERAAATYAVAQFLALDPPLPLPHWPTPAAR